MLLPSNIKFVFPDKLKKQTYYGTRINEFFEEGLIQKTKRFKLWKRILFRIKEKFKQVLKKIAIQFIILLKKQVQKVQNATQQLNNEFRKLEGEFQRYEKTNKKTDQNFFLLIIGKQKQRRLIIIEIRNQIQNGKPKELKIQQKY
ncbi:unnamed protein product (macronuclear) [Paramecium tetraurelia]|uniref:Transmembrane protein n=1 Tax=Paramecium tetraurelia TaxID=5888 RepID=A0BEY3_PARTE|nr:uncharacterized protein GSPATT00028135001 [Paramecium tetraurelia]CAK57100.1 unnamed protein product [Paramecium tetraurelia]|eukprot:XP_001424498.1 hypothetical protein (macronuclear) [Paramecium tetraurelia strain d4-2]